MDVTDLPDDLFLLVARHLTPRACIRCRAVSRQWRAAFTAPHVCHLLLRWNFPRCREMRLSSAAAGLKAAVAIDGDELSKEAILAALPVNLATELRAVLAASVMSDEGEQEQDWAALFHIAARRYHHLRQARPRLVEKIDMSPACIPPAASANPPFRFRGVTPWNRWLRLNNQTAPFHYPDPVWSYSQENGILVYPIAAFRANGAGEVAIQKGHFYHVLDLETGSRVPVPFDVRAKLIRRIRIADGVLIMEWAEAMPYHKLSDQELVHRHYVTAFDVIRTFDANEDLPWNWAVTFRSEWKLHFCGLPINRTDRFISAHTTNLYAVYFWQPNRSLYNDDPIEQVAVWDISCPSKYRPSEDPRGDLLPHSDAIPARQTGLWGGLNDSASSSRVSGQQIPTGIDSHSPSHPPHDRWATDGPHIIRHMAWNELDFYGLRQNENPKIRSLSLDAHNLYIVEEEHRWADGQHSSLSPPRVHLVKCTGIPVVPMDNDKPEKLKEVNTGNAEGTADERVPHPVLGPRWMDSCGANGDINMSFCQRVGGTEMSPYSQQVRALASIQAATLINDTDAGGDGNTDTGNRPGLHSPDDGMLWPWNFVSGPGNSTAVASSKSTQFLQRRTPVPLSATDVASATMEMTTSAHRWPGWAPCWRHENFPYLTVSEIFDSGAGVRVTARHCFMLETLSVHVRPAVTVKRAVAEQDSEGDSDGESVQSGEDSKLKKADEVHFPDDMWGQLCAKGQIAGDERWVIGEDAEDRITILRF